ncbi:unnamed protein product [Polarella glacialis]|uniref:non-specific serine/threonine protein kinase n=1 Tax=Polarella glacialis TaxID=89957 RepID=A0A813HW13_POLGL|nr:unnamed protein product [Polarella glacialis]
MSFVGTSRASSSTSSRSSDDASCASDAGAAPLMHGAACPRISSPFEKISCLGEGGFGDVWLARCRSSGLHVALKEVPRVQADARRLWLERAVLSEVSEARHQGEASTVSPALVGLVASFATPFAVCLAMDLVEGATLNEHVRAAPTRSLPEAQARWYVAEIAGALDWLHGCSWLYRDLKMTNVLVCSKTGRVKLVDFGFARRGTHVG